MSKNTRSKKFRNEKHSRYWWYKLGDTNYVPPIYQSLSNDEWQLMQDWFDDTSRHYEGPGELSIPGISLLAGLIGGNGIGTIVQCGHYIGYSTLLIGFLLRSMGKKNGLFSVDIDSEVTEYTQKWVDKAGLQDYVKLHVADSAAAELPQMAESYFGRPVQMVFIDSSHQYRHTLAELEIWYKNITPGGMLLLHDVSQFAQQFDATDEGGVYRAVREWSEENQVDPIFLNDFVSGEDPNTLSYRDGCGLGIIQKKK